MKLSTRLGLIVGCVTIGIVALCAMVLKVTADNQLADRHTEVQKVVSLAANQVKRYVALEKAGTLTRDEAMARAIVAVSSLVAGDDYIFVRDLVGTMLAHPDAQRVGKVDMGPKGPDGRTTLETYLDALKSGNQALVTILTKRAGGTVGVPKLNGVVKIPEWDWIVGYGLFIDDIDAKIRDFAVKLAMAGMVMLILVVGITVWVSRGIYQMLGCDPIDAARIAQDIASGNLTQDATFTPRSGSLLEALNSMRSTLAGIIRRIQIDASNVSSASVQLTGQMDNLNNASREAADAVAATAAAIEELAVSVDHISQSSKDTEIHARDASTIALQGEALVSEATVEISRIAGNVEDATTQIDDMVQRTTEIGSIANVIKEIADQTNLLALNAAIEAARAGDQGRGFSVVADEVRKLAERTSQATDQIAGTVKAITNDTEKMVASIQAVSPQVTRGVEVVERAKAALQEISAATTVARSNVSEVAAATQEQSQASASVSNSVERISSMLEESAASVGQANENVRSLERLAADLTESVAHFRL